jgi:hypothetical protein
LQRIAFVLAAVLVQCGAAAQTTRTFGQAELDRLLAPIALYPDPLLSQILMAATYPLEVVEAARWSRRHPELKGEEAVRAAADKDWDPSVKSLLAFPHLLGRMDENLEWTRALGEAFLAQEPQVMETVQRLRRRAQAAGNLASDERLLVVEEQGALAIQPARSDYVHVPYYDPWTVYGAWWWPAPPVYWVPWPGYVVYAWRPAWYWGPPVPVFAGFFFGRCDWRSRAVHIGPVSTVFVSRTAMVNRSVVPDAAPVRWRHDPWRRQGPRFAHAAQPAAALQPAPAVPLRQEVRAAATTHHAARFSPAPRETLVPYAAAQRPPGAARRDWHGSARAAERPVRRLQGHGRF